MRGSGWREGVGGGGEAQEGELRGEVLDWWPRRGE